MQTEPGYPFRFACRRSGNCCARPDGEVRPTSAEVRAIAAHLGLAEEAFARHYLTPGRERLKDGLGGRCVFLIEGRETSCSIHPVRPARCRSWPFWPELRDDPEALRAALRLCPGIQPLRSGSRDEG